VKERVEVASEAAVVVLADSQAELPVGLDQDALLRNLEPRAHAGDLFFLVTDDPVAYRIDLAAGEPAPGPDRDFEGLGGVFGLQVPSGRAVLVGWGKSGQPEEAGGITVTQGTQLVSVLTRRPFETVRHDQDMRELLGAEWEHMQKVNKLGLVGCLPLLLTLVLVLIGRWTWLAVAVPVTVLCWLPYVVLKWGARFQAAERRSTEHERSKPHYVISLSPAPEGDLSGGFLRV
jgi:hypothetical protein